MPRPRRGGSLSRSWSEAGWPLLADDVWRLLHDDRSGVLVVDGRAAALALSAGLLGELVLAGRVTVGLGVVQVVDRRAPQDAVAHTVLDCVDREPAAVGVRSWLEVLARGLATVSGAYELVAQRMLWAGQVREQRRHWWSRELVYPPTDTSVAAWPAAGLASGLRRGVAVSEFEAVLTGICFAVNLQHRVFAADHAAAAGQLSSLVRALPTPLAQLIGELDAAVTNAVLHRR